MEVPVGEKKELSIPPIWDCCGPTRDSFFTHRQIKHPPFSEISVKTHSPFGPQSSRGSKEINKLCASKVWIQKGCVIENTLPRKRHLKCYDPFRVSGLEN